MSEHPLGAWIFRLKRLVASNQRRWRVGCGRVIVAGIVLAAVAGQPAILSASNSVRSADLDDMRGGSEELEGLPAVHNSVYDHFLQGFRGLQSNAARRRYLTREVIAAANQNRIDPDLLFALVAVESRFNSTARSSKGARGLGQMMYATAHSVVPSVVRRPEDLYNVHRNLFATASLLRQLLIAQEGDLQAALTAYHLGPGDGHLPRRAAERYVQQICTYFASLKAKREFRELVAMNP